MYVRKLEQSAIFICSFYCNFIYLLQFFKINFIAWKEVTRMHMWYKRYASDSPRRADTFGKVKNEAIRQPWLSMLRAKRKSRGCVEPHMPCILIVFFTCWKTRQKREGKKKGYIIGGVLQNKINQISHYIFIWKGYLIVWGFFSLSFTQWWHVAPHAT